MGEFVPFLAGLFLGLMILGVPYVDMNMKYRALKYKIKSLQGSLNWVEEFKE